jgi:hypothetical protein
LETSQTFGDKRQFAIHYRPCPDTYNYSPNDKMAICHLIIDNTFIGRSTEECYLPTWIYSLTDRRKRIADTRHLLFPKEFETLATREIFETILKANQLEEEFHPDFLYLPQLENELWSRHSFDLDETINGYLFYFYVKDSQITFLIEDETGSLENDYRSGKFLFFTIPLELFFQTVDEATAFLIERYPYLKESVSTRTFNDG